MFIKLMNFRTLQGKTIAITGATGGLGKELVFYMARLGASLILLDRNPTKSRELGEFLQQNFKDLEIDYITTDLENFESVKSSANELKKRKIDVFIHNAGAYSIPRRKCDTGYDNVFQINFISPYYIIREILPYLKERVIIVGSIAHNYSKIRENDIDFSLCEKASKVYGNAKRFLMFSLFEFFKNEEKIKLSVTHPGITFTNITAHYPKLIFMIIKHPMKIIFHSPKKAMLNISEGLFCDCGYNEWIGPRFFNVWGKPKLKKLSTCKQEESQIIASTAEEIYNKLKEF